MTTETQVIPSILSLEILSAKIDSLSKLNDYDAMAYKFTGVFYGRQYCTSIFLAQDSDHSFFIYIVKTASDGKSDMKTHRCNYEYKDLKQAISEYLLYIDSFYVLNKLENEEYFKQNFEQDSMILNDMRTHYRIDRLG